MVLFILLQWNRTGVGLFLFLADPFWQLLCLLLCLPSLPCLRREREAATPPRGQGHPLGLGYISSTPLSHSRRHAW